MLLQYTSGLSLTKDLYYFFVLLFEEKNKKILKKKNCQNADNNIFALLSNTSFLIFLFSSNVKKDQIWEISDKYTGADHL